MAEERTQLSAHGRRPFLPVEWPADPPCDRIHRNDETVELVPKGMAVLFHITSHPATVLDPRKAVGSDPRHPQIIETLSRKE